MTDHVANAEKLIADTDDLIDEDGRGRNPANEAFVTATQSYAHATLALVEVTERLAVAQETANLIAIANGVLNLGPNVLKGLSEEATDGVTAMHDEAVRRGMDYLS